MIKFSCNKCSHLIRVDEKYSGKKGKCPKCGNIIIVPEQSTIIEFTCETCEHKIKVPGSYSGKKGACPKCKNPVVVPTLEKKAEAAGSVNVTCAMCGTTMKIPDGSTEEFIECSGCGSYIETSSQGAPSASEELATSSPSETDEDLYEEAPEEYEESGGMNRRLIILISGIAAVVVVGLIILAVVIGSSGSPPAERPEVQRSDRQVADTAVRQSETDFEEAKAFTERYITLLENGEIDEAYQLHSPELAKEVYKFSFEKLSERIGSSRIIEMNCTETQWEPYFDAQRISLSYDLNYEEGMQKVDISVLPIGQDFKIDKITARDNRGSSLSIGINAPRSPSQSRRTAGPRGANPSLGKFFCGFAIVILVFSIIQIISMWIIFEKDGRPGWASIVPFYNMWVLAEIGDRPGWMGLVMCFVDLIPFVGGLIGFLLWIVISLGVAKTFGRGVLFGIGLCFLPFIFYPILAFTKD